MQCKANRRGSGGTSGHSGTKASGREPSERHKDRTGRSRERARITNSAPVRCAPLLFGCDGVSVRPSTQSHTLHVHRRERQKTKEAQQASKRSRVAGKEPAVRVQQKPTRL